MIIKAGETLITEHGSYEDYGVGGPFRVLKDLDQKAVSAEFLASLKPEHDGQKPDTDEFEHWLLDNRYIERIPKSVWYLGNYHFEPPTHD